MAANQAHDVSLRFEMDKEQILAEIRRTAIDGEPLGERTFAKDTGIQKYDWFPHLWNNWGEALVEAGFQPNQFGFTYEENELLQKYIALTRKLITNGLAREPIKADLLRAKKADKKFPNPNAFLRVGSKHEWADRIVAYCESNSGYDDVAAVWRKYLTASPPKVDMSESSSRAIGYVYMLKHGSRREYKIGKTYNAIRREGEIRLELPEKLEPVWKIATIDPTGIEAYWHNRFASKRKNGEWFELTADDVREFKRWKRIC